jgi:hypothetical protein
VSRAAPIPLEVVCMAIVSRELALFCPRCGATTPVVVYGFGSLQPSVAMCLRCWSRLRELDCLLLTRRAA